MIKRSPSKASAAKPAEPRIRAKPSRRSRVERSYMQSFARLGVRSRMLWVGGVLFGIGAGLGTGLGLTLAPSSPAGVTVAIPPSTVEPPLSESQALSGPPLPVTTRTSEAAKRAYLESTAEPDPTPEPAPPLPPAVPPATESTASEPATDPSPKPVDQVAALPPTTAEPAPDSAPSVRLADPLPPDAWRRFAAAAPAPTGKPRIAIVLDDLGIDQPRSWAAIELAAPMTLAILPYGYNLQDMSDAARDKGHEVLVHVPMAPLDLGVDPGPNALQRELGPAEILRRLNWDLSQFSGYVGINNHMGSRFTAHAESMSVVINELRRRGLVFLDSVTNKDTQGYTLAEAAGIPFARRNVFLDNDTTPEAILRQLRQLERVAREEGAAIAIGHPHDETVAAIRLWRTGAEARGFEIVPLSALLKQRGPS